MRRVSQKGSICAVRLSEVPQFVGIQVATANAGDVCVAVAVWLNKPGVREDKFRRKWRAEAKYECLRVAGSKMGPECLSWKLMWVIGCRSLPVRLADHPIPWSPVPLKIPPHATRLMR